MVQLVFRRTLARFRLGRAQCFVILTTEIDQGVISPGHLSAATKFGHWSGAGLVAIARLVDTGSRAIEDQKWFSYSYGEGNDMVLPVEPSLVRCSASGAEVQKGGGSEVRPKAGKEFSHCGISTDFARLVWRHYFAAGTNLTAISTLVRQDALTQPARLITGAAMAVFEVPTERSPSSFAVSGNEEGRKVCSPVVFDAETLAKVKRRLCDLKESCFVKRRKVPESVAEAVA